MLADDFGQQKSRACRTDKRNHHQRERMRERGAVLALAARKGGEEAGNARAEVDRQAEDRAQLDYDGIHLPEAVAQVDSQQRLGTPQAGGGTDRQKFSKTFNYA